MKIKVLDALRVEGKSGYEVLCYGVFPIAELSAEVEGLQRRCESTRWVLFQLVDEGWTHGVLRIEAHVDDATDVAHRIVDGFEMMHISGACLAALCMYDGVFSGCDELFSSETSHKTYAYCARRGEPVISLDTAVIESEEWSVLVGACRRF